MRVKVTRCIEGADEGRVVVERMDAEMHTHDIEASFRIKKPSMVRRVLESECAKGGRPAAEIFKALKGAKTGDGLSWLETAGGASLKR